MRKLYILVALLLVSAMSFGQAPSGMSYQGVVRDSGGALVVSQAVGMQISILLGSSQGNAVYRETQLAITNANGLVSLEIGTGSTTDDFSAIDWSSGSYFIKTETDPTGGNNYSIVGTSQLMSMPYALYAKTSGSSIAGAAGRNGIDGARGATGPQGLAGAASTVAGPTGPQGQSGAASTVAGPTGADGKDGATGAQGTAGNDGAIGAAGPQGANGANGATGPQGLVGNDGAAGAAGLTTSVNAIVQRDGNITLTTTNIPEGDKKYYTEALVSANADVAANKAKVGQASGTVSGDMQYWNGTAWVVIATTPNEGATLQLIGSIPTCVGGTPPPQPATVGDFRAGGIVFWVDPADNTHGLVCALQNTSIAEWG
jgi:hypothetical protein